MGLKSQGRGLVFRIRLLSAQQLSVNSVRHIYSLQLGEKIIRVEGYRQAYQPCAPSRLKLALLASCWSHRG